MSIDYEDEVKKMRPDAADHYNDLFNCWFVKNSQIDWEYYGQSTSSRANAWRNAYYNLIKEIKNQTSK